jgi:YD repeat-containing protein
MTYDMTGQVRTSTDANGNVTTYSYADNFFNDVGDSSNPSGYTPPKPTDAYPTVITRPTVNSVTAVDHFGYYWGTGERALSTDPNNQTTYFHFYDSLDRPTGTRFPDSGWHFSVYTGETQVDAGTGISSSTLSTNCPTAGNACRHDQTLMDGLGRVIHQSLVSDPSGQDSVDRAYDTNGRLGSVSNPHRPSSTSTDGTEYYAYDGLDRKIRVTRQDGSVAYTYYGAAVGSNGGQSTQLCSGYGVGYPILNVDEAGHKRQTWTDGFGRIIEVDEPNSGGTLSVPTCYSYDLNDNLAGVLQNGSRQRSFTYDSLSRLTQATNPESGAMNYTYDANGNLKTKMDARNTTTTYNYDALNRLTQKLYSDGTPGVGQTYDVKPSWYASNDLTNLVGRLVEVDIHSGSTNTSTVNGYDAMGRVVRQWQQTPSMSPGGQYDTYAYDLAGNLTSLTYPSGRVVTSQYNAAMQPTQVTFASFNGTPVGYNYLSSASYAPTGAATSLTLSSGVTQTECYNNRLQPGNMQVANGAFTWLNRTYNFYTSGSAGCSTGSGGNNGNVMGIADNLQSNRTQSFTYDTLNRISTAQSAAMAGADCWGQSFGYDAWANLLAENVTKCSGTQLSVGVNSQNRITNSGISYDAAGDMLADGVNTYTYDAESRISTVNGAGAIYTYDANGRRVRKATGSAATEYIYSTDGQVLSEYNPANGAWSDYIYANGQRIARDDTYEDRIVTYGTTCSNCGIQSGTFSLANNLAGYVIQSGDKLFLRQYQGGASQGGMTIAFTDNTTTVWSARDQDGIVLNQDTTSQTWHYRRVDLSSFAGKTISGIYLVTEYTTPAGPWDFYFEDIVLVSSDGTVHPIYSHNTSVSMSWSGSSGITGVGYAADHWQGANPVGITTYYHRDHLGSARLTTNPNGYRSCPAFS